jgi:hypothetical protein
MIVSHKPQREPRSSEIFSKQSLYWIENIISTQLDDKYINVIGLRIKGFDYFQTE